MKRDCGILLVEDSRTQALKIQLMLEDHGYHATMAQNGLEAMNILLSNRISIVISDWIMPEMDGYEATKLIRSSETEVLDLDIPIIALTASAMSEDKAKCLSAGMNDYIAKPVNPQEMIDKVKQWSLKS